MTHNHRVFQPREASHVQRIAAETTLEKRVHIVGGKNHGKTTLVVELVELLRAQGLRVGTIKHTHHHHELDTPEKDSYRHRQAGAAAVGILSPSMNVIFWPPTEPWESTGDRRYDAFAPLLEHCDVVLVEGDTQTAGPKIEVWRASIGTRPLAERDRSIVAIVTDDAPRLPTPIWPRAEGLLIAEKIIGLTTGPHRPLSSRR